MRITIYRYTFYAISFEKLVFDLSEAKGMIEAVKHDILKFIDSPDVREFNKNTVFTPAQQAILVSRSEKTMMI